MHKILKVLRAPWFAGVLVVVAVVAIGVGVWLSSDRPPGMKTFSWENGGFKYSLLFYSAAKPIALEDGSKGLAQGGLAVVAVKPVSEPAVKDCKSIGEGWTEATTYELGGKTGPICAYGNGYATIVELHGGNHLVTLTYKSKQNDSIYPTLQSVYGSLTVSE